MLIFNKKFEGFASDGLIVGNDTVVSNCYFKDGTNSTEAHRDAIQVIPNSSGKRLQYALAVSENIRIITNKIDAPTSQLQGIFASDGLFKDLQVIGNIIDTASQHFISVAGLLSGNISWNFNSKGELVPIRLYPARICGSRNIFILSFKKGLEYPAVEEVTENVKTVKDYRASRERPGVYLKNFDRSTFLDAVADVVDERDLSKWLDGVANIALKHGQGA